MLHAALAEESNVSSWSPVNIQELMENFRQIRLYEEEMFRDMLRKKQMEIDGLHQELHRIKEEMMEYKRRFWR
ncbi:MAG: hypothetical protein KCHDKBKB_02546 [Elusimicrobia bacterium]|nr:hypothetical protein [Elusimicrobiota bacterium]